MTAKELADFIFRVLNDKPAANVFRLSRAQLEEIKETLEETAAQVPVDFPSWANGIETPKGSV